MDLSINKMFQDHDFHYQNVSPCENEWVIEWVSEIIYVNMH